MIRYALVWLGLGGIAAIAIILALGGGEDGGTEVAVPPVRETELARAATTAGCRFTRVRGRERLNPPVDGPRTGAPARPGVYDRSPATASLTGATRRGIVVIHYRPGLGDREVDQLRVLQRAVPAGTIVVPNATRMPYELAVTGYKRLLGCRRFSARAIDAAQLFRGRYLGRGPDSAR